MPSFKSIWCAGITFIALTFCLVAGTVQADNTPLDLLVGRWDVRIETLKPEPKTITYSETFRWVLGGRFLEGRTDNKSDGGEDISYGHYDAQAKGYPLWVFSSSGSALYLAPGSWDSRRRTLRWKNPPNFPLEYETIVEFPNDKTRRWTVMVKDWKGSVMSQQSGSAVRR